MIAERRGKIMQYIMAIIILAILFIGGPIVLIGNILSAPSYLQILMLLWIAVLMLGFILSKKPKTAITFSAIVTLFFSIFFTSWYVENVLKGDFDDGGLGDAIGIFVCTFAAAVPFGFIATKIRLIIEEKMQVNDFSELLEYAKNGMTNRIKRNHQSKLIKNSEKNIDDYIKRLKELRKVGLDRDSTTLAYNFCNLLMTASDNDHIKICLEAVTDKKSIVDEIQSIESHILQLANRYKDIGNIKKCMYYLEIVQSNYNRFSYDQIKKSCDEQLRLRQKENKAIKFFSVLVSSLLIIVVGVCVGNYIKNIPYRELKDLIDTQSLTVEMCDWKHREEDNSFYEYIQCDKGYQFLASELTEIHKENDIAKAMWLLCVQPNCVDGINMCTSDSFSDWIVDYGKKNGITQTSNNGDTVYCVDGYKITIDSLYKVYHEFRIDNGHNSVYLYRRNPYHEESVPTIY